MTSPWANAPEKRSTSYADQYKLDIDFTEELQKIDRWGHAEINGYLFYSISDLPDVDLYMHLHSSQLFRGIHNAVIDAIQNLLENQENGADIISDFSEILKSGITNDKEWSMILGDVMVEIATIEKDFDTNEHDAQTAAEKAVFVTRMYAALMEHGSCILDADDFKNYVHPQLLEHIGIRAEKVAHFITETSDLETGFSRHLYPETSNFIEEGYAELLRFIDKNITALDRELRNITVNPHKLRNLSDEANDLFNDVVCNTQTYKAFLNNLKSALLDTKDSEMWPSLYEMGATTNLEDENITKELAPITKETGIGQFITEIIYENRATPMHPQDVNVVIGILKEVSDKFPSRNIKKLGLT